MLFGEDKGLTLRVVLSERIEAPPAGRQMLRPSGEGGGGRRCAVAGFFV
jgi:hypothetical protein